MDQVQTILQQAAERGAALGVPYQGSLLPQEAHDLMQLLPSAVLVDVRCAAEWQFVGMVPNALCIEWRSFPGMQPNAQFLPALQKQVSQDDTLMLMCRSGVRSDEAARAALAAGYRAVYNVLEGFEGDKDGMSQRGHINGWKMHGLPWVQG
ncbi:rhodanese-like domain-containing protein [Paludibacterium purpuratum]|uniref:Thiosulfate sulfurtransferase n=1 Tax=Paludibacterium purpuratum TaxID=1144873 RepID=A0A4R7B1K4_9NEIS|nr:rhodanese-like domain-containing protein [Paludibacterium purpuratum]TDR73528.1 thiosulfate sulfurtransferase [Paludibacterium purpuratum]